MRIHDSTVRSACRKTRWQRLRCTREVCTPAVISSAEDSSKIQRPILPSKEYGASAIAADPAPVSTLQENRAFSEAESAPVGRAQDCGASSGGAQTFCGDRGDDVFVGDDVFDGMTRPRTRADCENASRPCPWVGCKYHLYLHVKSSGMLHIEYPDREPDEIPESCVLDVTERMGADEATLDEIGHLLNLTKERLRQIIV